MFLNYVVSNKPHSLIELLYIVEIHQKGQVIVVLHVSYWKQKQFN